MTETSVPATDSMKTGLHHKGVSSRHIVAIVVSALIFGAIIYVTRFLPFKMGTIQMFYPAAIVAPLFGVWFGVWGSAGLIVGNILSMLAVGLNPALFPLALLAQFMMGFLPGAAYRKTKFEGAGSVAFFVALVITGQVVSSTLVALNLLWIQHVPAKAVWGTIWPWMQFSNTLMAAVFSPLLFAWLSDYISKSGLFFKRFLG
ncbi:hypothetical protein [Paenibacillus hamazuiensis]|uniref:hypothetical protein n=1 Tax=Paenibacillus hamazuiensis TaxID=2936508 RepID=UPI00200FA32E|nr:hypothetical protein [Paenibacillus hamazuiensis]